MHHSSRRQFLGYSAAAGLIGAVLISIGLAPTRPGDAHQDYPSGHPVIEVNFRTATVLGVTQPDGSHGVITEAKNNFRVRLKNRLDEEALIHWHELMPPWRQDGVPDLSQGPLAPGAAYDYDFALARPGTSWMHSHHGLQEQRPMAAPLIVRDPTEAGVDMQEVVVIPRLHLPRSGRNSRRVERSICSDGRSGSPTIGRCTAIIFTTWPPA